MGIMVYCACWQGRWPTLEAAGDAHRNTWDRVLDMVWWEDKEAAAAEKAAATATASSNLITDPPQPHMLKCLGWRHTDNCDPNGPVVEEHNRSCHQYMRGGVSGYCLLLDQRTGREFHAMEMTCDSVQPKVVFSCASAIDFVLYANQTDTAIAAKQRELNHSLAMSEDVEVLEDPELNATEIRGIVMVIYPKMQNSAYAGVRMLRSLNCTLPIEIWYLKSEMGPFAQKRVGAALLGFGPLSLHEIEDRDVTGFNSKIYALENTKLSEILFLDADNFPVKDPVYLFETPEYQETGAVFWPDFWHPNHTIFNIHNESLLWPLLGMDYVNMFEQESGQLLINKRKSKLAMHALHFFAFHEPRLMDNLKLVYGDKDLFRLAWLKTNTSFHMIQTPPGVAGSLNKGKFCGMTMVQFDPRGEVIFLHRNAKKIMGYERIERARIWTHLQTFDLSENGRQKTYANLAQDYRVAIYNGAPEFTFRQWCYGQWDPDAPMYTTISWANTSFSHIEDELIPFAHEAHLMGRG